MFVSQRACHAVLGVSESICIPQYVPSYTFCVVASAIGSYLVDPASSHMLVSKIKPCMSKYQPLDTVKLRTAHYISDD